jgi:predicted ATP-grasp superfamily ATP-dependent carboligase
MRLSILGACARPAAQSAIRAGMRPLCLDLFADRDLKAIADTRRIDLADYPDGLEILLPRGRPWIYVGALENHPALIDRMANLAPLWGNRGDALRLVRSPFVLREWMTEAGLLTPVTLDAPPSDATAAWLVKPLASGGGRGIEPWRGEIEATETRVYQSFCPGKPASAVFLGDGSTATLLGATEQLLGTAHAEFEYVGNIGPIPLSAAQSSQILRMGRSLARRARLIGLFGVDLILDGDRVTLIEVNPRYTASVDILEWSQGRSLLGLHCGLFQGAEAFTSPRPQPVAGAFGKAILRAPVDCVFNTTFSSRRFQQDGRRFPMLADIPNPGTPIAAGEPVLTVYARATTVGECRRRLKRRLEVWTRRLRDS